VYWLWQQGGSSYQQGRSHVQTTRGGSLCGCNYQGSPGTQGFEGLGHAMMGMGRWVAGVGNLTSCLQPKVTLVVGGCVRGFLGCVGFPTRSIPTSFGERWAAIGPARLSQIMVGPMLSCVEVNQQSRRLVPAFLICSALAGEGWEGRVSGLLEGLLPSFFTYPLTLFCGFPPRCPCVPLW